jgi:hypothetical protein
MFLQLLGRVISSSFGQQQPAEVKTDFPKPSIERHE